MRVLPCAGREKCAGQPVSSSPIGLGCILIRRYYSGQNVCIYHLLGDCRFGELKCVYSHSRTALPMGRGWWNDPAQVARVKGVLEVAEKNAREAREARALETKLRRDRGAKRAAAGKAGKRKEKAKEEVNGKDKEGKEETEETKLNEEKEGPHGKQEKIRAAGAKAQSGAGQGKRTSEQARSIEDDEDEQRLLNGGFTDYQLNELLEQGVKPWDNDAHVCSPFFCDFSCDRVLTRHSF
jgi:hypothetical protein